MQSECLEKILCSTGLICTHQKNYVIQHGAVLGRQKIKKEGIRQSKNCKELYLHNKKC